MHMMYPYSMHAYVQCILLINFNYSVIACTCDIMKFCDSSFAITDIQSLAMLLYTVNTMYAHMYMSYSIHAHICTLQFQKLLLLLILLNL